MSQTNAFQQLGLSAALLQVIEELGYTAMTPIQEQSIPALLKGRDLIGQSKTGSGKTAAFSLPILQKIDVDSRRIQALIMCPTRELCAQVAREIRKLARRHAGLQVLVLAGGQFIAPQLSALEKGAHIAVGTPGRLMDIIGRRKLDLSRTATVVLDEADRMLDMGFEEDMQQILAAAPKKRQTVFFSATFPESIAELSKLYQVDPVTVTIQEDAAAQKPINQIFVRTEHDHRVDTLTAVLKKLNPHTAIVFCNLKAVAKEVAEVLAEQGFSAASIHGDLEQYERDRVMAKFRNQSTRILVATDVASRGIDIDSLDLVVNYDTPAKPDVYVHRVGRTGRAGKTGVAVSLLSPKERHKMDYINDYTKSKYRLINLEELGAATAAFDDSEESTQEAAPKKVQAFGSPVVKEAVSSAPVAMETLCIFGGRKDKLRPGDILGALTGEAGGFKGSDIGKIEIHDRLAYVAVRKDLAKKALENLQNGRIKGRTFKVSFVD